MVCIVIKAPADYAQRVIGRRNMPTRFAATRPTRRIVRVKSDRGIVYLVGAGPGDFGLLTLRGRELLESAQVVVYDFLVNPQFLTLCPTAEKIYVGKQAARHSMTQDEINALLVAQARLGRRVVRLKGGDPFVFGRGGEECAALAAAALRFEVVPGVTASIASAAYAGIPITHRDLNSSFTFVTGHEKEADYQEPDARARGAGAATDLDYSVLARLPALAFYMGVKSLPRICRKLIESGMPADTPAATIRWGTTPRQKTVAGTLADLPEKVAAAKLGPPAVTIVGRIVALRETLGWFENRPLFGQTVVVTRTRQQAGTLTQRLTAAGARIIEAPTIETLPPASMERVDEAVRTAGSFDWVIFTSAAGPAAVRERLDRLGTDARVFGKARLAAIGEATAAAVRERLALRVDLMPTRSVAEALADDLRQAGETAGKRFLLLRADIARPALVERLRTDGAVEVADVAVYETRRARSLPPALLEALDNGEIDWITFTSGSTARNLAALLGPDRLARLKTAKLASIGPITSQTLRQLGLTPAVEAATHNIDGLVAAMTGQTD